MSKLKEIQVNAFIQTKAFVSKVTAKKSKGSINQLLAVAVLAVILIIVEWPQIKSIATTMWSTITTWFSTNLAKVFTNLT